MAERETLGENDCEKVAPEESESEGVTEIVEEEEGLLDPDGV